MNKSAFLDLTDLIEKICQTRKQPEADPGTESSLHQP